MDPTLLMRRLSIDSGCALGARLRAVGMSGMSEKRLGLQVDECNQALAEGRGVWNREVPLLVVKPHKYSSHHQFTLQRLQVACPVNVLVMVAQIAPACSGQTIETSFNQVSGASSACVTWMPSGRQQPFSGFWFLIAVERGAKPLQDSRRLP